MALVLLLVVDNRRPSTKINLIIGHLDADRIPLARR